ncbi:MAG: hypothetical protein E7157_05705 [Lactobacillales bacterium]|nr:hypothetical protein [Lactobacillales bacterium]
MKKKVTIYNSNNHKFEADLLLCFEVPEINERYIVYSFPSNEENTIINVGNLRERGDNCYYIEELDNEEEWNFIKKVMLQIVRESK